MSGKRIHLDHENKDAEKVVASILHWFVDNKQTSIMIVAGIIIVLAGISSFNYMKIKKENEAKTQFSMLFINQEKNGRFDLDAVQEVYETNSIPMLAGDAAFIYASEMLNSGKYDEAMEWFDNALGKKDLPNFIKVSIYVGKGVVEEHNNNINGAVDNYEKALSVGNSEFNKNDIREKIILLKNRVGETEGVQKLCNDVISDTTATNEQVQTAKNILATL